MSINPLAEEVRRGMKRYRNERRSFKNKMDGQEKLIEVLMELTKVNQVIIEQQIILNNKISHNKHLNSNTSKDGEDKKISMCRENKKCMSNKSNGILNNREEYNQDINQTNNWLVQRNHGGGNKWIKRWKNNKGKDVGEVVNGFIKRMDSIIVVD
jgi:hypothetical protein